jgi:hypothetical protein
MNSSFTQVLLWSSPVASTLLGGGHSPRVCNFIAVPKKCLKDVDKMVDNLSKGLRN